MSPARTDPRCCAGKVSRPHPAEGEGEAGDRTLDLEPGQVVVLEPGEEIQTSAPADSGGTY